MSEWISVEDRLPKDRQRVLVCFIDDVHRKTWHFDNGACQVATFGDYYGDHHFSLDCESVNGYLKLNLEQASVTHWMPLPEPPK
jgi:hypothetical protein